MSNASPSQLVNGENNIGAAAATAAAVTNSGISGGDGGGGDGSSSGVGVGGAGGGRGRIVGGGSGSEDGNSGGGCVGGNSNDYDSGGSVSGNVTVSAVGGVVDGVDFHDLTSDVFCKFCKPLLATENNNDDDDDDDEDEDDVDEEEDEVDEDEDGDGNNDEEEEEEEEEEDDGEEDEEEEDVDGEEEDEEEEEEQEEREQEEQELEEDGVEEEEEEEEEEDEEAAADRGVVRISDGVVRTTGIGGVRRGLAAQRRLAGAGAEAAGVGETTSVVRAAAYDNNNMVAAMNEHLSTSSATSGARTTPASTNVTTSNSTSASNNGNASNNCTRNDFQALDEDGKPAGILSFPCDFDHMYASMTDGGAPAAATATSALGVSPLRGNEPRQNDLTEVKHLKELLLLHLDLIQQQSEQIVTKDKLLAALRQENETLKLRLERMDRRVSLQKLRSESTENSIPSEHISTCPTSGNSVNIPSTSDLHRNIQSDNNTQYNESFKIRLNTSGGITTVKQELNDNQSKHEVKQETGSESRFEWEEKKKRRSDPTPLTGGSKRKRGVSCSSTISNDTASTIHDKSLNHDGGRKTERKGKSLMKKESFLTTEEHYYTAVGDSGYSLNLKETTPMETNSSLEVPNWRVKIYTSCYTMEGTENLDDEIFNKRHLKLENDERRRKRWDVQRIREQRHIEKLKQRQERQNHQATCYNTNHTGPCPSTTEEEAVTSLWPDIEQIQSLQVDPQLPVSAFGAPIPSFTPSEFSLPWSSTTRLKCRRPKRSTGRRKASRR